MKKGVGQLIRGLMLAVLLFGFSGCDYTKKEETEMQKEPAFENSGDKSAYSWDDFNKQEDYFKTLFLERNKFASDEANKDNIASAKVQLKERGENYIRGIIFYNLKNVNEAGGQQEHFFATRKDENSQWEIVFSGFTNKLIPCTFFEEHAFPEDFRKYADCGLVEKAGISSNWKLVSGNPLDNCSSPVYEGEVKLKGYYVFDYFYVEKEWLFRPIEEDLKKIWLNPAEQRDFLKNFKIIDISEEEEERLKKATKKNPAEITIRGLNLYCEGGGVVSINKPE